MNGTMATLLFLAAARTSAKEGLSGKPIEAIFSDVDGTLVYPQLPDDWEQTKQFFPLAGQDIVSSSKEMIKRIELSNAVDLIPTTGRSPGAVARLTEKWMPFYNVDDHYVIGNNGNLIYGPGKRLIHSGDIDPKALKFLEELAEDVPDIDLYAYIIPENNYVLSHANMLRTNGGGHGPPRTCDFNTAKILPKGQSIYDYVMETNSQVNVIRVESDIYPEEYYNNFKGLTIYEEKMKTHAAAIEKFGIEGDADAPYIDILPIGVNKKDGVEKVLKDMNLTRKQCMSLGDGSNDMEFMQACDTPVAMGNGKPKLRRVAAKSGIVTDHISKHGWYNAVNKFVDIPHKKSMTGDVIQALVSDDHCPKTESLKSVTPAYLKKASLIVDPVASQQSMSLPSFTGVVYGGMTVVKDGKIVHQETYSEAAIEELVASIPADTELLMATDKGLQLLRAEKMQKMTQAQQKNAFKKANVRAIYTKSPTHLGTVSSSPVTDSCSEKAKEAPLFLLTPSDSDVAISSVHHLMNAMEITVGETLFVSRFKDGGKFEIPNYVNNCYISPNVHEEHDIEGGFNFLAESDAQVFERFIDLYYKKGGSSAWYAKN